MENINRIDQSCKFRDFADVKKENIGQKIEAASSIDSENIGAQVLLKM